MDLYCIKVQKLFKPKRNKMEFNQNSVFKQVKISVMQLDQESPVNLIRKNLV